MTVRFPALLPALIIALPALSRADELPPNVVIILTDDQGYHDVGVFGAEGFETPNLDRMAAEGRKFTRWYSAQAVCSASRAALLTGCYPNRIGIHGALGPGSKTGIADSETTIAEICKSRGYRTAIFGKWHLGDLPPFLPTRHGFDEFFGIPYSNDMWPKHPTAKHFPPLPLIEGEKTLEFLEDQSQLTTQLTTRATDFISRNKDHPFFLYVPHPQPHVPLFVSEKFAGKSKLGLYGDVIMEIDWSVGQILDTLKKEGIDDRTLVIFTSDNGPWLSYGTHSGSAKPLREGKGTSWEGGVREPCIMRWPGKIPPGTSSDTPGMHIDLLPTIAGIIGADPPALKIDGRDIWPVLSGGPDAESPHAGYWYYYARNELQAVSMGEWKLYFPHSYRTLAGRPGRDDGLPINYSNTKILTPELYNLANDVSESQNLAAAHPEIVDRLSKFAEAARLELGDSLTKRTGPGTREPGVFKPSP